MSTAPDEVALIIDLATGEASSMAPTTLSDLGLRERSDLQRWITAHPEIVGRDLLLVTSEFDQWELRDQKVPDRLDVLFLDSTGSLLVAELKRDKAADTTDLQALKYAAYCSQLTVDDVVDAAAKQHKTSPEDARQAILDHAPALTEGELGPIRVRLVAGQFGASVTSVVLWLRDHDIDVGCIEVTARLLDGERAVLSSRQFIPLPEAEDYLVRRRRKEQEEEQTKRKRRKLNSVPLLDQAGVVKAGDAITLKIEQFSDAWRPKVQALVDANPSVAQAEWTGLGVQNALRWARDGELYSCTGLVKRILAEVGVEYDAIPGPDYWLLPTGRSMFEESKLVEASVDLDGV